MKFFMSRRRLHVQTVVEAVQEMNEVDVTVEVIFEKRFGKKRASELSKTKV